MEPSPSNNVKVQLSGLLRSSHALLGLLAIVAATMFALSLAAGFTFGEYLFAAVFVLLLLSVLIRYQIKGPESERSQPSLSLTHQDNRVQAQFVNFDVQQTMSAQMVAIFQAVLSRRPLPAPSGIIEGLASDPSAFRPITVEMAQTLRDQDTQLLSTTFPQAPAAEGSDPFAPTAAS